MVLGCPCPKSKCSSAEKQGRRWSGSSGSAPTACKQHSRLQLLLLRCEGRVPLLSGNGCRGSRTGALKAVSKLQRKCGGMIDRVKIDNNNCPRLVVHLKQCTYSPEHVHPWVLLSVEVVRLQAAVVDFGDFKSTEPTSGYLDSHSLVEQHKLHSQLEPP